MITEPEDYLQLSHNQISKVINLYIEEPLKNRMNNLVTILVSQGYPKSFVFNGMSYELWDRYCSVAYDIYCNEYFGKPTKLSQYKGIVKLADMLLQYTVDKDRKDRSLGL